MHPTAMPKTNCWNFLRVIFSIVFISRFWNSSFLSWQAREACSLRELCLSINKHHGLKSPLHTDFEFPRRSSIARVLIVNAIKLLLISYQDASHKSRSSTRKQLKCQIGRDVPFRIPYKSWTSLSDSENQFDPIGSRMISPYEVINSLARPDQGRRGGLKTLEKRHLGQEDANSLSR
jgi:hypothetical protein